MVNCSSGSTTRRTEQHEEEQTHSEEKIIGILREAQGGMKVKDVCARHNISVQTYYGWKRKYGGMQVDGVRQARALSEEPSVAR